MFADYDAASVTEVMGLETDGPAPGGHGFAEERPKLLDEDDGPRGSLHEGRQDRSGAFVSIERAVEQGLPRQALRHVAERIAGQDRAKVSALEWTIVPKTTLDRREIRLSPQESERTERVARLFVQARRALGSEDEARVFMTAPHPELDGRSPVEATRSDLATRRVERILGALEYGLVL